MLPPDEVVRLLEELKSNYDGFTWESELWRGVGSRRSPYRTLVLFGLSARTRDALLVEMCRRFFLRYPDAKSLAEGLETLEGDAGKLVRAGQVPIVMSMSEVLQNGVPRDCEGLLRIKGVGEKIAQCVLGYGWGEDALPLDANCVRVLERVFGLERPNRGAAGSCAVARGPEMRLSYARKPLCRTWHWPGRYSRNSQAPRAGVLYQAAGLLPVSSL